MGFIRGTLLTFVCVLLFVSLLGTGIFGTLNKSLDYEIISSSEYNFIESGIF